MRPFSIGSFNQFVRCTGGSVATMMAISSVPLLAAAGAAIDYVRWTNASTTLIGAMDAAVLSGTQALLENGSNEEESIKIAKNYYDTAMQNLSPLLVNEVKFKMNSKGNGIAAQGDAAIETTVLKLVGISSLPILSSNVAEAAVAEAGESVPGGDLELSLMLDVTGSMCNDNEGPCTSGAKIDALKDAATTLIDTIVWEDQSTYTSKLAIVPFSTRVRVAPDAAGSSIMKKLTDLTPTWSGWYKTCTAGSGGGGSESESSSPWSCTTYKTEYVNNWKLMPCVTDRFYDSGWKFDLTDDAPGSAKWLNAHGGNRMVIGVDSSNTAPSVEVGAKKADPATHWNYSPDGKCYDIAQGNEVLPLTNDKAVLKNRIASLEAFGATGGVLGTAFSCYMLSPNWKTVWTGQSQPKKYELLKEMNPTGAPKLRKIAILMTDGVYNTMRGWKDQDTSAMAKNAKSICTAMKAKGIEIYTVGFALDSLTAMEKSKSIDMLKSCGSSDKHFYQSTNAGQLMAAFKDIGNAVSESVTRLTK